jgi:ABC-type sugar transport system substrate-binding protein
MAMPGKQLILAAVFVGAAAAFLYYSLAGRSERVSFDTYDVLGAVTAEETARLLGSQGEVLVLARDTGEFKNPSVEAELEAFRKTMKKHPGMKAVIQRVPLSPSEMLSTGGAIPAEQLVTALESHPKVRAVVLFFGFPALAEAEDQALRRRNAKIVVVSSFHSEYKQLLEGNVIHLAIVPRSDAPTGAVATPHTVRERFDQEFAIITATTVGTAQ